MPRKANSKTDKTPYLIAELDAAGVLLGYKAVDKVPPGAIIVPANCDLEPGRYRWDKDGSTFVPITATNGGEDLLGDTTNALDAIASALAALADGKPVPNKSRIWALDYLQSFDRKAKS